VYQLVNKTLSVSRCMVQLWKLVSNMLQHSERWISRQASLYCVPRRLLGCERWHSRGNEYRADRLYSPTGPGPSHFLGFMITLRHTVLGRTRLEEWSARRRQTSTWEHTTLTRDSHPWSGAIRTCNPSQRRPMP